MLLPSLRKLRILVLVATVALLPQCLPAQVSANLSGNLSQPLTNDPETQPITTLATDLLAPQRSYVYDPTGANILSTAMSPYVDTSNASNVRGQTDTQIRDSTQTGHISPYATLASRLGASSSPDEAGADRTGSSTMNDDHSGDAAPVAENNFGELPGDEDNGSGQSGWGTSDSFGSRSSNAASRRAIGSHAARLGEAASSDSDVAGSGESRTSSRTGNLSGQLPGLQSPSMPGSTQSRGMSRDSNRTADASGMPSNAGSPTSTHGRAPTSGESALLFSPQSYTEYTFGQSPFSSPGDNGDLTFLNPNIFAAGIPRGPSSRGFSRERRATLREQLEEEEGLATSATGYGLESNYQGMESDRYGKRKTSKPKKNPYLSNEDDAPNSQ